MFIPATCVSEVYKALAYFNDASEAISNPIDAIGLNSVSVIRKAGSLMKNHYNVPITLL